MNDKGYFVLLLSVTIFLFSCGKKKDETPTRTMILSSISVGVNQLNFQGENNDMPVDSAIHIKFDHRLDTNTVKNSLQLLKNGQSPVSCSIGYSADHSLIRLTPDQPLDFVSLYQVVISSIIKGESGETFTGANASFNTMNGKVKIVEITINGKDFRGPAYLREVDWKTMGVKVIFSEPLDPDNYQKHFYLTGDIDLSFSISADHKTVNVTNVNQLKDITKYTFAILPTLKSQNGYTFGGFQNDFFTALDTTSKFPPISDEQLLTLVQQRTFRYFYDDAHPVSGMARERNSSGDIVTSGGSGFGLMALVVGIHRGFITRVEGLTRLAKILGFLEQSDRFHGAWPHWLNGATGKTIPFTPLDNGGDLVETSYLVQGLYTFRQYLNPTVPGELALIDRINTLINGVDYTWYTRGENVLYWHWSSDNGWAMNMQIRGYNETLITYVVAASSTSHPIEPEVYHQGYARNGAIKNGKSFYGYKLPLGENYGGPLFFTHYSFLGLDPTNLKDAYADYMEQNVNQSMINLAYCIDNPKNFIGYGEDCWGLTACDNPWGYNAHSPTNDLGVIAPTAALSAFPYTPAQSMKALHHFYYHLGDRLFGDSGFYDAFDMTEGWWANSTLAIDQGPIICMIENYRSGLLWDLYMSCPEVKSGLTRLGFTY